LEGDGAAKGILGSVVGMLGRVVGMFGMEGRTFEGRGGRVA